MEKSILTWNQRELAA